MALELAETAANEGSFGVGAVLLGPGFKLLQACRNRVLVSTRVNDPTAHAERQLIDWYFVAKASGRRLPPREDCMIVTTLDPCLQCTGAILASGFRCIAIAADPLAGVHYAGWNDVSCLPPNLRDQARAQLSCFCVHGVQRYFGARSAFAYLCLEQDLLRRAEQAFSGNLQATKDRIVSTTSARSTGTPDIETLRSIDKNLYIETVGDTDVLAAFKDAIGAFSNSEMSAFFDPQARLLIGATDEFAVSPIRNSLIILSQKYARLRLIAELDYSGMVPKHPREIRLLTEFGPGTDALSVMTIGAYGGMLERPAKNLQSHWSYLSARQPEADLEKMIARLPPLYSKILNTHPVLIR